MTNTLADHPILILAGLTNGQKRSLPVSCTRRSGWYVPSGWIGWGDLSNQDMEAIAFALADDEVFIVLHEQESYRRFLRYIVPDSSVVVPNEDAPEPKYLADHALFVITRNCITRIDNAHPVRGIDMKGSVGYQIVSSEWARKTILTEKEIEHAS